MGNVVKIVGDFNGEVHIQDAALRCICFTMSKIHENTNEKQLFYILNKHEIFLDIVMKGSINTSLVTFKEIFTTQLNNNPCNQMYISKHPVGNGHDFDPHLDL